MNIINNVFINNIRMYLLRLLKKLKLPPDLIVLISTYLGYVYINYYAPLRLCNIKKIYSEYENTIITKILYDKIKINNNHFVIDLRNAENQKKQILKLDILDKYKTIIIDKFNLLEINYNYINILDNGYIYIKEVLYLYDIRLVN